MATISVLKKIINTEWSTAKYGFLFVTVATTIIIMTYVTRDISFLIKYALIFDLILILIEI